jgi:adenylate cyclase
MLAFGRTLSMAAGRIERKLAAILAADIAGYSRLMGVDEETTISNLADHRRELIDPCISKNRGRIVKTTGDGLLVEFASVVDSVRCAVEMQAGMAERNLDVSEERRLEFRIGINVGDIIEKDGDIFGDGVNIAARLEGIAEPGGICVSGRVQEDVAGKIDPAFEDAGEHALKNIARPVRVYRLRPQTAGGPSPSAQPTPSLPNKPSIAVLPFQNMSGDAEQEYFADGMVEEIITALSRVRWLFVIARNSSFTYKGRAVDVKQVARELGVRYVLEGSVRRAGNRVRIAGQLIEVATGANLWAERFDGPTEDIFDLQDKVTAIVVSAIAPKLEQAEILRAQRKPTESLDAYDLFLRGMAEFHKWTRDTHEKAQRLFYQAIERDPNFSRALAMASYCFIFRMTNGWMADREGETGETERLARRAVSLGRDDPDVLCRSGHALAYVVGDLDGGAALIDLAIDLNPNLAIAWFASGWVRAYLGEADTAIDHLVNAMRLSPVDPEIGRMQAGIATAHLISGRYEDALLWAQKALRVEPTFPTAARLVPASYALCGRLDEARRAIEHLRVVDPMLRLSNVKDRVRFRRPEHLAAYLQGLREAGLPE